MALSPGTRLGPYEITGLLGVGGMGEVYRATDTSLKRQVAVKVLPEAVAADPERLARFQREAEVLAALNHPNIATIHGLEQSTATTALVMELVEGPTLADRIAQGAIPVAEALPIARQIAQALEAAHEQGIVHRDLKPANVKVRADGTVKVLDFGLAKAVDPPTALSPGVSQLATVTTPVRVSQAGVILGTAAYMSPEQARGKAVDKRTDIWAFGCVLYEMLTGRRAFEGDDVSDTLAAVLRGAPDWSALPATTAVTIRRLLRRSLEKDRARRLADIGDAGLEIDDALNERHEDGVASAPSPPHWRRLVWVAAGTVALTASATALVMTRAPRTTPQEMRFDVATVTSRNSASFALSPDGHQLVYSADDNGVSRLWLRSIETGAVRVLPGTDNGQQPFWSPDARSLAFTADGQLKRLDLDTGSLRTIVRTTVRSGGTWNRDGIILYPLDYGQPIHGIPAAGGAPVQVFRGQGSAQQGPYFLPDGRHFVYQVVAAAEPAVRGIWVAALDGSDAARLVDADSPAIYAAGHLLYVRQGTLVAQPFDPDRRALTGDATPIAEQVAYGARGAAFTATPDGTIAYRHGDAFRENRRLAWVNRSGAESEPVAGTVASSPALSSDGRRVAVFTQVETFNVEVSVIDTTRGGRLRLTFNPGADAFPIWSPRGNAIAFQSYKNGTGDVYRKAAISGAPEELLVSTPEPKHPTDWSPDDRVLMYRSISPKTGYDLWTVSLDAERKTAPLVQTAANERDGQFSPDGKWMVYESDETGRYEIYLQPFPAGGKIPISVGGGAQARWNPNGKEIFYVAPDDGLMAVPIQFNAHGEPALGKTERLFTTQIGGALQDGVTRQQYAVSPDGQRFLMNVLSQPSNSAPITLILNWKGFRTSP